MPMSTVSPLFSALAISATLLSASPALAEAVKMTATLEGSQQVPPVETTGKGSAEVTYDTDSKKLDWTVEYSGLGEAPAAGHFHGPAPRGASAGVVIPFEGDIASPIKGSTTLTEEQAADLLAGKYYINIHTPAHKGGELRGQVEKAM